MGYLGRAGERGWSSGAGAPPSPAPALSLPVSMNHVAVGIWEELEPGASPALPGDATLSPSEMEACQGQGRRVLLVRRATLETSSGAAQGGVAAITDSTVHFFPEGTGAQPLVWRGRDVELAEDGEGHLSLEAGDTKLRFGPGAEALLRNAFESGCRGAAFPVYDAERTEQLHASELEAVRSTPAILLSGTGDPAWRRDEALLEDASVRHSVELRKQLSPGVHELSCSAAPSVVLPLFIPVLFDRTIVPGERRTGYLAVPADEALTSAQQEARGRLAQARDEMRGVHARAVALGRHILAHETELFADQDLSALGLGTVRGGEMTRELEALSDALWDRAQALAGMPCAAQNRHVLVEAMELAGHALDILRGLRLRAEAVVFNTWADLFFARRFGPARRLLDVAYGATAYDAKGTVTRGLCRAHYASLCRVAAEVADRVAALEALHAAALVPRSRAGVLHARQEGDGAETAEFHPATGRCALASAGTPHPDPAGVFVVRGNVAEPLEGALCGAGPRLLVELGCGSADVYAGRGGRLARLASYTVRRRASELELVPEGPSPLGAGRWVVATGAGGGQASVRWEARDGGDARGPAWTADPGIPVPALLYLAHRGLEGQVPAGDVPVKSRLHRRMLDAALAQPAFTLQREGERRFNASSLGATYPARLFTPPVLETELAAGLAEAFGEGGAQDEVAAPDAALLARLDERRADLDRLQDELVALRRKLPGNSTFALPPRTSDALALADARESRESARELLSRLDADCAALRALVESFPNAF